MVPCADGCQFTLHGTRLFLRQGPSPDPSIELGDSQLHEVVMRVLWGRVSKYDLGAPDFHMNP